MGGMGKLKSILSAAAVGGFVLAGAQSMSTGAQAVGAEIPSYGSGWMVRLRAIGILPDEDTNSFTINGAAQPLSLDVSDQYVPELDISYFFNDNIAVELVLATAYHHIDVNHPTLGPLPLGDTWVLPPTLLLQYHVNLGQGIKPYVGAGINYTIFYGESGDLQGTLAGSNLSISDEFGLALQAGVDVHLGDNIYFNADFKYIWLNPEATVQTALGATRVDFDLNPIVVGVGFGYRFGGVADVEPMK